jgi:hypothetical protein
MALRADCPDRMISEHAFEGFDRIWGWLTSQRGSLFGILIVAGRHLTSAIYQAWPASKKRACTWILADTSGILFQGGSSKPRGKALVSLLSAALSRIWHNGCVGSTSIFIHIIPEHHHHIEGFFDRWRQFALAFTALVCLNRCSTHRRRGWP